jgi:hypothetical protein
MVQKRNAEQQHMNGDQNRTISECFQSVDSNNNKTDVDEQTLTNHSRTTAANGETLVNRSDSNGFSDGFSLERYFLDVLKVCIECIKIEIK